MLFSPLCKSARLSDALLPMNSTSCRADRRRDPTPIHRYGPLAFLTAAGSAFCDCKERCRRQAREEAMSLCRSRTYAAPCYQLKGVNRLLQ